jgi:hypothetical protein
VSYPVLCGAVVLTSANNTLRITEGATTANVTIPAGTYYLRGGYATNLITQSENLSTWTLGSISVSAHTEISPQRTTAYLLSNTTGGSSLGISRSVSFTGNGQKIVSAYLKSAMLGAAYITDFDLYDTTAAVDRAIVRVTWSAAGVPTLSVFAGNATLFSVVDVGGGWYRVAFAVLGVIATNSNLLLLYPAGIPAASGSVYAWGVQAENLRNVIQQPNDLSLWSLSANVTATSTAGIAPDGGAAYLLNRTTAVSSTGASISVVFTGNGSKTVSLYIRAGTATITDFDLYDAAANVDRCIFRATWSGGVPTMSVVGGSGTIGTVISAGSGWYLVTVTIPGIVAANSHSLLIYPPGIPAATGTVYAWGVQTYNAIVPGLYVPTTGSSVTGPSDELTLAVKTALEAATASANTYDVTVARSIDPASAHTRVTITRTTNSDAFGVLWGNASTTTDERLLGYLGDDIVAAAAKASVVAAAGNWVGNDIPRELEPVSERIVSVPRAASGRVQGVSRSARMLSWRLGLAFVDERRMLVERALSYAGDTLEGFLERFGANAAVEVWEVPIDTGTTLVPLSLARLVDVVHFSEDALSSFEPVRLGPGVPLYSLDMRLHAKV